MKKQILVGLSTSVLLLQLLSFPIFAVSPNVTGWRKPFKDLRKEFKQEKKDLRQEFTNKLKDLKKMFAKIINGEITAKSGISLTVIKDAKIYTVNTDSNTQFRRHFWGKSSLDEFSVGDKVNVYGKFTDDAQTTILARLIRNLSIMKRRGVFFGTVSSKGANSFVMHTLNRGDQTVMFDSNTKFVKRNEQIMTFADLQVGDRVRVKGLWDKILNTITEVNQIKDFSLPLRPTGGVSPTVEPSSTPTVTLIPTLTMTPTPTP